jgi:hypothetical protein
MIATSVAKALLGFDIDVLAGKTRSFPWPFRKARAVLALRRAQPPFVLIPAFAEVAAHQQENAQPGTGDYETRPGGGFSSIFDEMR